jgi:hypothetical protein
LTIIPNPKKQSKENRQNATNKQPIEAQVKPFQQNNQLFAPLEKNNKFHLCFAFFVLHGLVLSM